MFLSGSLVLILLTEILGQDDKAASTLGPIRIKNFPESDHSYIGLTELFDGTDYHFGHVGFQDQSTTSPPSVPYVEHEPETTRTPGHLPDRDYDHVGLPGLPGPIQNYDKFPDSNDKFEGPFQTYDMFPDSNNKFEGIKLKVGCQRGSFDSPEFDANYRLNMTDPPAYLKEYYASFKDNSDFCSCNYFEVIRDLKLFDRKEELTMSRPVVDHLTLTYVYLEMSIASILNVKENDQLFISHIWLYMTWHNKLIVWNPAYHCGIKHIIVPKDTLWTPDIIIEEMVEKDKTAPSPFLKVSYFGEVEHRSDQVVMGACSMDVYKFPFDVQQCNISFKSLLHSDDELRFVVNTNTTVLSKWADNSIQSQHEWIFLKMTVRSRTTQYYFGSNQTAIVYTVFMKRRAILHFTNFLLPIFFFLCMDLASFLIPDSGGEKISFRITVLLAVTVLQLILHEILPCSSKKLPLIAVYCVGIFLLMLLSLLEAILARYLVQKDSEMQDEQTRAEQSRKSERRGSSKESEETSSPGHTLPDKSPPDSQEMINGKPSDVSLSLTTAAEQEKVSSLFWQAEVKPGHWTRLAKKINRVFFMLYLITAALFLIYMFSLWQRPDDDQ